MIFQPEISSRTIQMMGKIMSDSFMVPLTDLPLVLAVRYSSFLFFSSLSLFIFFSCLLFLIFFSFQHALLLGIIIASFWLLDSLKDPILFGIVGMEYQPIAKLLSVIVTLIVVCLYDYLTSVVTKQSLFHIISLFFGILFMIISAFLSQPGIGSLFYFILLIN